MGKLRPFVRKDSYMPNKKWIPFVIGNGYTTTDGASGPAPEYETVTGNPVSFNAITPFPLRQLSVAFSPVQDLHGYDAPWPAGGGKNKLPKCVAGTYTSGSCTIVVADDGTMTLSGTTGTSSTNISIPLAETVYTPSEDFYLHFLNSNAMGNVSMAVENSASQSATSIYGTLTPANRIIKFTGTDRGISVNRIRFWIAANATISGTVHPMICLDNTVRAYSPYSNLCPISGWDSLNVYDDPLYAGVIEWNQRIVNGDFSEFSPWGTTGGAVATVSGNVATVSLTTAVNAGISQKVYLYKNHKYFRTADVKSSANITLAISGVSPVTIAGSGEWERISDFVPWTPNDGDWYFNIVRRTESEAAEEMQVRNVFLCDLTQMFGAGNEPATVEEFKALFPHDYYPYNAGTETLVGTVNGMDTRTISISLGSTVYGGTLDVTNGTLTVDRVFYVWQSGGYLTSTNAFAINKSDVVQINSQNQTTLVGAICDKLQSGTWEYIAARTNKFSAGCVYGNGLAIRIPGLTTAEEYTAWLAENTPSFCYKLATPFELTLTPEQISTLRGTNNVWSDAGDLTVEYRSN